MLRRTQVHGVRAKPAAGDWLCPPTLELISGPNASVTVLGEGTIREMIKVNLGHKGGVRI